MVSIGPRLSIAAGGLAAVEGGLMVGANAELTYSSRMGSMPGTSEEICASVTASLSPELCYETIFTEDIQCASLGEWVRPLIEEECTDVAELPVAGCDSAEDAECSAPSNCAPGGRNAPIEIRDAAVCYQGICNSDCTCSYERIDDCCLSEDDCGLGTSCNTTTNRCENPGVTVVGTIGAESEVVRGTWNECSNDSHCDDGLDATSDSCQETTRETSVIGSREPRTITYMECVNSYADLEEAELVLGFDPCESNADCNDRNLATTDNCVGGQCYNTSVGRMSADEVTAVTAPFGENVRVGGSR